MPAVDESFSMPSLGAVMAQPAEAVRFHLAPVRNEEKTIEAGYPVFDDVEYIEIRIPGDRLNIIDKPVTAAHKQRYAPQYAAWKNGRDQNTAGGMPLSKWPQVTVGEIETLSHFRVYTVEQLAGLSDAQRGSMGAGWLRLVTAAKDFLAAAKDGAHLAQMRSELERRDAELATLKEQVAALMREVGEKPRKSK